EVTGDLVPKTGRSQYGRQGPQEPNPLGGPIVARHLPIHSFQECLEPAAVEGRHILLFYVGLDDLTEVGVEAEVVQFAEHLIGCGRSTSTLKDQIGKR